MLKVMFLNLSPAEYEKVRESYNIISTIPVDTGWEVQIVADERPDFNSSDIIPNIEHAYVYYMEHRIHADISE